MNADGYRSYADPSTVLAEGVHQFIQGAIFGSIWSMVTPFPAPGSSAALAGTSSVVRLLDAKRFSHVSPILNHLMPRGNLRCFSTGTSFLGDIDSAFESDCVRDCSMCCENFERFADACAKARRPLESRFWMLRGLSLLLAFPGDFRNTIDSA